MAVIAIAGRAGDEHGPSGANGIVVAGAVGGQAEEAGGVEGSGECSGGGEEEGEEEEERGEQVCSRHC